MYSSNSTALQEEFTSNLMIIQFKFSQKYFSSNFEIKINFGDELLCHRSKMVNSSKFNKKGISYMKIYNRRPCKKSSRCLKVFLSATLLGISCQSLQISDRAEYFEGCLLRTSFPVMFFDWSIFQQNNLVD